MPNRTYQASPTKYRYGFNGKENDNETVGTGEGTQDYGMRIYNPALGRFLSVDPLSPKYPSLSPYPFAMNRPIDGIDIDGLEWIHFVWINVTKEKLTNGNSNYIFTKMTTGNGKVMEDYKYDNTVSGTKDVQLYVFENELYPSSYNIPGYKEAVKAQRDHEIRIAKDILTITGGVIAIVATGGVAGVAIAGEMSLVSSVGLAWSVTSAQIAVVGGTSKLVLDLSDADNAISGKIPTSLGGSIGLTIDYIKGNKKGQFQAMGDVIDGVLTFNIPKNFTEGVNAAFSITNIAISLPDIDFNAGKKESKGSSSTTGNNTLTPVPTFNVTPN